MRGILSVLYRDSRIRFTNLAWLFWDLFVPIAYLLIFGLGFQRALGGELRLAGKLTDYTSFFLAGVLAMTTFGIAMNTSYSFFLERDSGIFYEWLTYPISRREYVLGKILFNLLLSLVGAGLVILLGAGLMSTHVRLRWMPITLLNVIVGTASWFFFFAIFALRIRRNDAFNSFTSICYIVLLFLSSMFYPLDPLPQWFKITAYLNPVTWQVDLLRFSLIGYGKAGVVMWESIAFLIFTLMAFAGAVRAVNRAGS
ncbi:MAG: ABC transporter permease [Acidobacteriia bacterium]|nr:ABC transporter permease [Terriglobia bacterium]